MFIVYSKPGCGGCAMLKRILKEKEIEYELGSDFEKLIEKGFTQLPILEIDGTFYSGSAAIEYAKKL